MKTSTYIFFGVFCILISGCTRVKTENNSSTPDTTLIDSASQKASDTMSPKFSMYNMCLTMQIHELFQDKSAIFDSKIINPDNNYSQYQLSYDKALNLGVYAVDICYTNVYEQYGLSSRYLQSMLKLSNDLGIPYHFLTHMSQNLRENIDSDSLYAYANDIYGKTQEYLNANDMSYASALIVLGGWVEALYISLKIAEQTASISVIESIAHQTKSVPHLMTIMKKAKDNKEVAAYIPKINDIDMRLRHFSENYALQSGIESFNLLQQTVTKLREQIVQAKEITN